MQLSLSGVEVRHSQLLLYISFERTSFPQGPVVLRRQGLVLLHQLHTALWAGARFILHHVWMHGAEILHRFLRIGSGLRRGLAGGLVALGAGATDDENGGGTHDSKKGNRERQLSSFHASIVLFFV